MRPTKHDKDRCSVCRRAGLMAFRLDRLVPGRAPTRDRVCSRYCLKTLVLR